MSFAEQLAAGCSTIAKAMGETVTLTPRAGGAATVIEDATFAEEPPLDADARDGQTVTRRATCTIRKATAPSPLRADAITRAQDGSVWAIRTTPFPVGGGDFWQLELSQIDDVERTRERSRQPR